MQQRLGNPDAVDESSVMRTHVVQVDSPVIAVLQANVSPGNFTPFQAQIAHQMPPQQRRLSWTQGQVLGDAIYPLEFDPECVSRC